MRAMLKRSRASAGFTLIEVLTAATLTTVGIGATVGVFGASHRTSLSSQRREAAVHQAQAALDRMASMAYVDMALSTNPAPSTDTSNPFNRVNSSNQLQVKSGLDETLVDPASGTTGTIFTGPERFDTGAGGAQISGYVYRFVSWRDEPCPDTVTGGTDPSPCGTQSPTQTSGHDTKRLTVAVTLNASGNLPSPPAIWISTIASDASAGPPGSDPGTGSGPATQAETFYLYDTRCTQSLRATPTTHTAFNTAATGSPPSTCLGAEANAPQLMGDAVPTGGCATPPSGQASCDFSTDLTGSLPSYPAGYEGGLVMKKKGTSCPTSYPAADTDSTGAAANRWTVHVWNSNTLPIAFTLTKRIALQLFSHTYGGVSGRGLICATLLDVPPSGTGATVIGSSTYDNTSWPITPTAVTFSWDLPSAVTVAQGNRLGLVISVRGESDNDLVFLYDQPDYASFLQVETSTPLP